MSAMPASLISSSVRGPVRGRRVLDDLMAGLPKRERVILWLRFRHDLTQHEIAKQVGVSQMQVSRLLRRSLNTLRLAAIRAFVDPARFRPLSLPVLRSIWTAA